MFALFLAIALICSNALADSCVANNSRVNQNILSHLSTNSVIDIKLSTVYPGLNEFAGYLVPASCLGYFGPIGPYGPLGSLGPLGSNTWDSTSWITGSGLDWSAWAKNMSGQGGVLSAYGPLGFQGPLSEHAYYEVCPCINNFAHHLMNGGVFSVLGPLGPLGALGPLGPLGPLGAHGYPVSPLGDFIDSKTGSIVHNITVPYDTNGAIRSYDLFEFYNDESYVKSIKNNDASWVVNGNADFNGDDVYKFRSPYAQYVTILLVPLKQLDLFSLHVTSSDRNEKIVAKNSLGYVNWIILKTKPGASLTATVKLELSGHMFKKDYNLYVVGSSRYFPMTDIIGNHIQFSK